MDYFTKDFEGEQEKIGFPTNDVRFNEFKALAERVVVEFCSMEIRETPTGLGLFATKDIEKGETVILENALISADVPKNSDPTRPLLNAYLMYRSSDLAKDCDNYLRHMASEAEVGDEEVQQLTKGYEETVPEDDRESIPLSDVLHVLKVCRANFYDHTIQFDHPTTGKATEAVLTNCYPIISLINHSCAPNVDQEYRLFEVPEPPMTFGSVKMELMAGRKIKAGEEILISYLDESKLKQSLDKRQAALKSSRYFDCACQRCDDEKSGKGGKGKWFGIF